MATRIAGFGVEDRLYEMLEFVGPLGRVLAEELLEAGCTGASMPEPGCLEVRCGADMRFAIRGETGPEMLRAFRRRMRESGV